MTRLCIMVAVCLVSGSVALGQGVSSPPGSWEPTVTPLPGTPAGRCAEAYFKAFNAGDEDVRRFEEAWRAPEALKERPIALRLESYRDLKAKWGTLTLVGVPDVADGELVTLARTTENQWLVFEFRFEPQGKLAAIVIDGPVEEAELRQRLEPLDDETRDQTIRAVIYSLNTQYVFPEVAAKMEAAIKANVASGKYAAITSAPQLASVLTDDLRAVCHDKHLRVRMNPGTPPGGVSGPLRDPAEDARSNYGFTRTEVLPGNIGYIKLDGFHPSDEARNAAAAAMAQVAGCDALIFDLRDNGGGSPRMVEFLGGYLYDKPTVLNVFFDRKGRQVSQTRTLEQVPGKKLGESLPVYVLTSSRTFSCAEEFAYDLQCTKRGTIVGETTGGGAHPVTGRPLNDRFVITIPYQRAENPVTKTNWEGRGVAPDISTPAAGALDAACADARKRLAR